MNGAIIDGNRPCASKCVRRSAKRLLFEAKTSLNLAENELSFAALRTHPPARLSFIVARGGRFVDGALVLIVALALRLYRIADYTTFQGDQGVDALAALRLLVDHILPVEGPATSAGGVHLGPFYYYLLAAPMLVDWVDPLADAVLMAVLGALCAALVYALARTWFGRVAGLSAGGLMAISPAAIVASRSAWNPAPTPFFVVLALCGLSEWYRTNNARWSLLVGFALGCVIQLHYFSLGIVVVVLAAATWLVVRARDRRGQALWALAGVALLIALLAPLAAHEVTTGAPNLRAATVLSSATSPAQSDSLPRRLYAVVVPSLVSPFLAADVEPLGAAAAIFLLAGLALGAMRPRFRVVAVLLGALLSAPAVLGVAYRGPIFPHYLIAYSPMVFLAFAAVISTIPIRAVAFVAVALMLVVNALNLPFGEPEYQLTRSETVAREIANASEGERFAIWLLAADESDGAYRFQLERRGRPAADASEPQPPLLFVMCQGTPCTPGDVKEAIGPAWSSGRIDWTANVSHVNIVRVVSPSQGGD